MIHRWTLWETDEGEPLQLSLCVMDSSWEPLMERTLPCGPFHTTEDRRLELLEDRRRWLRHEGHQLSLDE